MWKVHISVLIQLLLETFVAFIPPLPLPLPLVIQMVSTKKICLFSDQTGWFNTVEAIFVWHVFARVGVGKQRHHYMIIERFLLANQAQLSLHVHVVTCIFVIHWGYVVSYQILKAALDSYLFDHVWYLAKLNLKNDIKARKQGLGRMVLWYGVLFIRACL